MQSINRVELGRGGPLVSRIGLGCMGLSGVYGTTTEMKSIGTIHAALDAGVNFLDTADMYGPFTNEMLIGKAIQGRRDEVFLATKFGNVLDENGQFHGVRGDAAYVRQCCDGSLTRLGIETIDLYYQHRVDRSVPIEETIGTMAELVTAGKVRYLGLSEASPETIARASAVHPITALQSEYSLWTRDPEDAVLATTRQLGIGFVAYSPLGRGMLSGAITRIEDLDENDVRRRHPRFLPENFAKNLALVDIVRALAEQHNATPAQIALAWLLTKGDDIVPIPGTRGVDRLMENIASVQISLSQDDIASLESVFAPGVTAGERYPDMSTVNR